MTASTGIFFIRPIASIVTTCPIEVCGSKNCGSEDLLDITCAAYKHRRANTLRGLFGLSPGRTPNPDAARDGQDPPKPTGVKAEGRRRLRPPDD
jgi:hypothetical protein